MNLRKISIFIVLFAISSSLFAQTEANYVVVEKMPTFTGGDQAFAKYIHDNIQYPADAKKEKISGTVYVKFLITSQGKITNTRILRKRHPSLDTEALRVVNSSPVWTPGMQSGKKVAVWYTVPVKFTL